MQTLSTIAPARTEPPRTPIGMDSFAGEVVTMIALKIRDRKPLAALLVSCSYFYGFAESLLAPAKALHAARVPERSLRLIGTLDAIDGFGRRICGGDWRHHLDALEKHHPVDAKLMSFAVLVPGKVPHDSDMYLTACEYLGDFHPALQLGRLAKLISGPSQPDWCRVWTAVMVGAYEQARRMGEQWNALDFNMLVWSFQECAKIMPLDLTISILGQMAEKGQLDSLYDANLVCQMLATVAQLIATPGRHAGRNANATPALTGQFMRTLDAIIRTARARGNHDFILDCATDAAWFVKLLPSIHWRSQPPEDIAWISELTPAVLGLDQHDQSIAQVALGAAVVSRGIFSEHEWDTTLKHLRKGGPGPRE